MPEPANNPNPSSMVDPPRLLRFLMAKYLGSIANTDNIRKKRAAFEKKRQAAGHGHEVEYFHQLDDPYSHLTAQVLDRFAERYDIRIKPHLVRAAGGKNQPEMDKLATWARRDAGLIAPHYGLEFPEAAAAVPAADIQQDATRALAELEAGDFVSGLESISNALWRGESVDPGQTSGEAAEAALDSGSARLDELGHYSGAMFYYGGEWYWGVDRLFHLEQRLRELGACKLPDEPYIVPRPDNDVSDVDASGLELHFFPSLNSPYTSIIYDKTIAMAEACNIRFHHKPVLPMIMRGVPATPNKGRYILFDTKREGDFFGVPFGKHVSPIGTPTRKAYSLLPWATSLGKDRALLGTLLRHAWAEGRGLHKTANMKRAVEEAGLDWDEAMQRMGSDDWKAGIEQNQNEMVEGMGLWGVPCYKLTGPAGEPDLEVWGQDRLWLVAAEIRRRAGLSAPSEQTTD